MSEQQPIWILMPIAGAPELTPAAIADCLDQSVPTRLLLLCQGLDRPFRESLERIAEADPARIFCCFFDPPLPSLSAVWNHGLQFVWRVGGEVALVVNNDVRLGRQTVACLVRAQHQMDALFVSAVGVAQENWFPELHEQLAAHWLDEYTPEQVGKGGPDFSCFLLSKEGHTKYPFDESFIPAYGEDCDNHRRYMLGGDGDRIFSINLPYLHYASGTLKAMTPERRQQVEHQINTVSRAHYAKKWGGPVNAETYLRPFDPSSAVLDGSAATPFLQRAIQEVIHADPQSAAPGADSLRLVLGDPPLSGSVRPLATGGGRAGCAAGGAAGAESGGTVLAGSGSDSAPLTDRESLAPGTDF